MIQEKTRLHVTFYLEPDIWKKLKIEAKKENRNFSNFINCIIREYLNKKGE